jgi:spore cortex formation protein SpoVR/YcgB (stage V sporulation)
VDDLDLYVFEKKGAEWKITDKTWENIRDQLVYSRVNGGFSYLVITDGNHTGNGEMDLKHSRSFSTATEKPLTHSQAMAQGHIAVWFHI